MKEYNVGVYGMVSERTADPIAGADAPGDLRAAREEELELFMAAFEEEGRGLFTSEPAFVGGAELGVRVSVVAEGPLAAAGVVEGVFGRAAWRALAKDVGMEVGEIEALVQESYERRLERELEQATRGLGLAETDEASNSPPGGISGDGVTGVTGEASGEVLRELLLREPLVSMSEAADLLGVARQQIDRLEANRKRGVENRFPPPVAWPAGRPAWLLSEVESYGRKLGRERMVRLGGLRASRKSRDVGQEQLAGDAGVALSTVQRAEANGAVKVGTALRLAKGLGTRLSELSELSVEDVR